MEDKRRRRNTQTEGEVQEKKIVRGICIVTNLKLRM